MGYLINHPIYTKEFHINTQTISIIIPIYNTPKQILKTCFESIKSQSATNYEIIIIDDGSDKEYAKYIDELLHLLPNAVFFRKPNEGVSSARNKGLELATGEYILFLDADNSLPSDTIEIYNNYLHKNLDLVIGLSVIMSRTFKNNEDIVKYPKKINISGDNSDITVTDKDELVNYLLSGRNKKFIFKNGSFSDGPCGKIFKSSIAKQISFPINLSWEEDTVWLLQFILASNTIIIVKQIIYNNISYQFSATRRFRPYLLNEFIDVLKEEKKLIKTYPNCYYGFIYKFFSNVLLSARLYFFHKDNNLTLKQRYSDFISFLSKQELLDIMQFAYDYLESDTMRSLIYKFFAKLIINKQYRVCFILLKLYSMR